MTAREEGTRQSPKQIPFESDNQTLITSEPCERQTSADTRLREANVLWCDCGCWRQQFQKHYLQEHDLTAEILRIDPDEPEPALINRVVRSLAAGNVAALPTDTFYGLAVDPVNLRAVDRIYEIKTRARHKPLSLLIAETAQAYGLAREIDTAFDRLAERFWPGPLTIVVKAGGRIPLRVTANTGNVALRVPEAAIARAVVAGLGVPITATSANLRGMPECTDALSVVDQLGDLLPLIVDGGPTARAVPTTIVDLSGGGNSWMILREGAIPTHEIALALQM
jgi:tRNA threonylcarbamoyl adenosine modification protein (Sua5/YciO/YrdC/YwlC family)